MQDAGKRSTFTFWMLFSIKKIFADSSIFYDDDDNGDGKALRGPFSEAGGPDENIKVSGWFAAYDSYYFIR